MLPGNTPALFGGKAASLGNDAFTKLLAHFEGPNNYTFFYDSALTTHGYASLAGSPTVQNGSPLGASGNGVLSLPGSSYLTWPNSADWEFGAGDFTVDWWEYRSGAGGASICRDVTTVYCPFLLNWTSSSGEIYMTSNGTSWDIASGAGGLPNPSFGVLLTTWTHLAVTRSGNTFRAFRDGVLKSTWTSALALKSNTNPLSIGVGQTSNYFVGYMEEVRISKGIARWTANFTPPNKAYLPDSVPPPATKLSVSAPASATSSTAFNVTVTALDANNNRVPTYSGTVHFTSTNGAAVLPANSTLTNGSATFAVTLKTGTWTVTATDTVNASITGTSAAISVAAPAAKAVALGSSQTWTVPADWNSANNYIYCIGGGGGGGNYNYPAGGGGGGFARKSNIALTPNSGVGVAVGGGGAPPAGAGNGGAGGTTSFAGIVVATGGSGGGAFDGIGGAGGGASAGDFGYAGGRGGNGPGSSPGIGGGGGGAGGTNGAGGKGGDSVGSGGYGAGGGGCGGGTAGVNGDAGVGVAGAGGNSPWAAGGAGASFGNGGAGTNGSGGGGTSGLGGGSAGVGGNGPDYSGGGGGSGGNGGGHGGYYGGGGGAGTNSAGTYGQPGVIFIWWQPT